MSSLQRPAFATVLSNCSAFSSSSQTSLGFIESSSDMLYVDEEKSSSYIHSFSRKISHQVNDLHYLREILGLYSDIHDTTTFDHP